MRIRMLLIGAWIAVVSLGQAYEVVFEGESLYHHIMVTEEDGFRYLSFDETRGTQSAMKLRDPLYLHYIYTRLAFAGLAFSGEPKDVLFVGLGGASMPKFFRHYYPEANVDIAEIDPMIVEVAKKYFDFVEDRLTHVYVKDGRVFLTKTDKRYDLIFLDAYNTNWIPFHLTTKEFMEEVRRHLKPDGAAVSNIWSPTLNQYFEAEIKTLQATFPELYIFPGLSSGNYIFVTTNQPGQIPKYKVADRAAQITREKKLGFDLGDLVKSTYQYATRRPCKAEILTDDHAPVEVLRSQDAM
jgi:spermidine synthase